MVGFGSSLRMGRRSGWEAAYLDYESLKLLLSQIESVYEEGGHDSANSPDVVFGGENSDDNQSGRPHRHHHRSHARRDYRDELFLESDSDAAFASSRSLESSEDSSDRRNEEKERAEVRSQGAVQHFTMMGACSSDESSASLDDDTGQCGGAPWRTEKKDAWKSKRRRSKQKGRYGGEDEYYLPPSRDDPKSFFVNEDSESFDPSSKNASSSLFNAPFQYNLEGSTENTALLGFSHGPRNSDTYFGSSALNAIGDKTPPRQNFGTASNAMTFAASQNSSPTRRTSHQSTQQEKWEEERRRARKQRRRRRLARQRRGREKKVPPHIRVAHSKSRSITERFLGLLRAEVEKVTLFAQARLGELADTAGSLRFLSSEELTELSESFAARANSASAYDHPLSDGGIHPSASSSSDEGAGGQGCVWSGSSSDENTSHGSNQFALPSKAFAGGGASPTKTPRHSMPPFSPPAKPKSNPDSRGKRKQDEESYEAAKRKIEHFQELRRERPIFQRNDHIVGEDLLLVSAVDEADAYSAVGVELLHILKYICVNVIAVRKICRKHDRLLQNRMLGGYYHRKRTTRAQEERTLGGLIAHVAGDIYEAHPALIGLVNHGKLMGVYDLKIQQLANSRTVKVISSCLALALSEYEVSRTRADALATLTKADTKGLLVKTVEAPSPFVSFDFRAADWIANTEDRLASPCKEGEGDSIPSDNDRGSGPPSTASSVSLARLRFTVLSIAALREASRIKSNLFAIYLSRSSLSFTGQAVVGEGLDGCSRETLDFLVYYAPDAALLLDSSTLYEGLRRGRWRNMSIASVMRSSLAVALRGGKSFQEEEQIVINSLSILPKSEGLDASAPLEGRALPIAKSFSISRFVGIPAGFLRCNRYSLFLYTMNYYVVHPTANTFAETAGANAAYSAAVIGAASFSAILAAVLQCNILMGHTNARQGDLSTRPYKALLIFGAVSAIAGNVVQARGIARYSVPLAIFGRFLIGLSAASIVHRQFVVAFLHPSLVVAESARLVQFQAVGVVAGLCVGSLVELAPFRSVRYGARSLQITNWVMAVFWFIHLCRLVFSTSTASYQKTPLYEKMESSNYDKMDYVAPSQSSDSSDSDPAPGGAVSMFHQPPSMRDRGDGIGQTITPQLASIERSIRRPEAVPPPRHQRKRKVVTLMKRLRKLMAYNIAVPVSLALVVYTMFAQEVLFSSCALIADRYFGWRGNVAGFFLACLAAMILPVDFICEQVARRYEERTTIKRSMVISGLGLLVMVNWGSVFAMVANLKILFTETKDMRHHYYDWLLGIPQYVCGFLLTFMGLKALEGASRALLSKASPPNLRFIMTNLGTIVTFVGLVAQFLANFQILAVGLSHRVINTDIVNSLVMPLLIGCIVAYYFVRKHYFFLM